MKLILAITAIIFATNAMAATNRAFVSNERSDTVSVIDILTNKVIKTVQVGKRPRGVGVSPDGNEVYVAISADNAIAVLDPVKMEVIRTFASGDDPEAFAIHSNGNLYISNEEDAMASVYDPKTGALLATIDVGIEPEGVAVAPDGTRVAVTSESTNLVHIIGVPEHTIQNNVLVGARPRSVVFSNDSQIIYVTAEIGGEVKKIAADTGNLIKKTTLPDENAKPKDVLLSRDGKNLYIAGGRANKIFILDAESLDHKNSIPVGKRVWGLALSRDGSTLYTTDGLDHQVTVIDTKLEKVKAVIKVGKFPWGIALDD
jgi:PQQ-dependent catabolism-associated beta-propeller protein|tara:strand:- start:64 stop:1008 length:945 start_codon:yes stop_codon:yes gene_type:complete